MADTTNSKMVNTSTTSAAPKTCGDFGLASCEYTPLYAIPVVPISALTICGNLFNIIVLTFTRGMHNNPGYFMFNLALTDLCVGVIMASFMAPRILGGTWPATRVQSDITAFFIQTTVSVSLMSLTGLSVDRYLNISRPLHYDRLMSKWRCIAILIGIWTLTGVLQLPPVFFGWGVFFYDSRSFLSYFDYAHSWEWTVGYNLIFTVPCLLAIFTCHVKIFRITRRHIDAINATTVQSNANNKQRTSHKAMRTVVITITMFFICWTPFCFEQLSYSLSGNTVAPWPQEVHMLLLLLILSNSFMNCIIYSTTHKVFRDGARRILRTVFCRRGSRPRVDPYDNELRSRSKSLSVTISVVTDQQS
ncbi:G-protein coupled receptor 52-like [Tubulanus polymorphus]|uniref:G-protein coupled receptor 52-like n=1 Tax=Tubulanus polymorphus TaxID=672921 RepID=UPI003DA337F0